MCRSWADKAILNIFNHLPLFTSIDRQRIGTTRTPWIGWPLLFVDFYLFALRFFVFSEVSYVNGSWCLLCWPIFLVILKSLSCMTFNILLENDTSFVTQRKYSTSITWRNSYVTYHYVGKILYNCYSFHESAQSKR